VYLHWKIQKDEEARKLAQLAKPGLSGQRWVRFVDDNAARLHHPAHFGDCGLDIGERIAIDRDDIGDIAGCDRAQTFVQAWHLGRQHGCRLQRLFVGHAQLHEPAQLLHVQSVGGVDGIRADEQPRTGPVRLLRGYEITLDVIAQILFRLRGEFVSVVGAIEIVLIVIDALLLKV